MEKYAIVRFFMIFYEKMRINAKSYGKVRIHFNGKIVFVPPWITNR